MFTPEQYQWALSRVEELLPLVGEDTPKDDPNSIELEILSNLVADYSDENFSIGEPSRAEPTLSVARRICKNLNIDASVVLGL